MSTDDFHEHEKLIVPAGEFEQRCLALLDQVADTGMPIVVTKRGRPVARIVPIEPARDVFSGSLRVLTENEEELFSAGEA